MLKIIKKISCFLFAYVFLLNQFLSASKVNQQVAPKATQQVAAKAPDRVNALPLNLPIPNPKLDFIRSNKPEVAKALTMAVNQGFYAGNFRWLIKGLAVYDSGPIRKDTASASNPYVFSFGEKGGLMWFKMKEASYSSILGSANQHIDVGVDGSIICINSSGEGFFKLKEDAPKWTSIAKDLATLSVGNKDNIFAVNKIDGFIYKYKAVDKSWNNQQYRVSTIIAPVENKVLQNIAAGTNGEFWYIDRDEKNVYQVSNNNRVQYLIPDEALYKVEGISIKGSADKHYAAILAGGNVFIKDIDAQWYKLDFNGQAGNVGIGGNGTVSVRPKIYSDDSALFFDGVQGMCFFTAPRSVWVDRLKNQKVAATGIPSIDNFVAAQTFPVQEKVPASAKVGETEIPSIDDFPAFQTFPIQ